MRLVSFVVGLIPFFVVSLLGLPDVLHAQAPSLDRPMRAVHISGNWSANRQAVAKWREERTAPILPPDYIQHLKNLHVNWIGLSVALHITDSMDSTVERVYSSAVAIPTFSDDVLRQIVREYRDHGFDVFVTLAIESHEAYEAERPVQRHQLGDPGDPATGVPRYDPAYPAILPEFWPWRPSHPDHERFVREFWSTYTQQAVHIARIAQEEGVRMYSLGTETDGLFRSRAGGAHRSNHFLPELRTLVDRVRAEFDGLLTYDMHYSAVIYDEFGPGSTYLWEDLDLDVVGISAWFPLVEEPPSTVPSVDRLRESYERIFESYIMPLAIVNADRPIVFLEYGTSDTVRSPANPSDVSHEQEKVVFSDMNGNGLDDGQETQANMFNALFELRDRYPGLVFGTFFWDNWIADNEKWLTEYATFRTFSFRGKLAEEVVRSRFDDFRSALWLPPRTLNPGDRLVVSVGGLLPDTTSYTASSSAPDVASVSASGADVAIGAAAEGVATISVTATGGGASASRLDFVVMVQDLQRERAALEAIYRSTGGGEWSTSTNWLGEAALGDWYGVELNAAGRVVGLQLGAWDDVLREYVGNGLTGALPAELGDLRFLRRLVMEGNARLGGRIPGELGNLTNLRRLHFGGNALTGAVPAELGNLTTLEELNLGGNALTGPLPETLANLTNLEWLSLWGDMWSPGPPPSWLGELTGLRALDLGGHRFAGSIPVAWRNLGNLNHLYLWGNTLTGPIPPWFGSLANLQSLNLNGNPLTGPIPASLTRLSGLTLFDIGGTGVCVPDDAAIRAWLATIPEFLSSGLTCEGAGQPFADDPIMPGVTPVKAVHFMELRMRIDALRGAGGLSRFEWTDPVLQAGMTPVRLVHLLELRTAMAEAYRAAGQPAPTWTDAAATEVIRAVHLMELRAAVLALE